MTQESQASWQEFSRRVLPRTDKELSRQSMEAHDVQGMPSSARKKGSSTQTPAAVDTARAKMSFCNMVLSTIE